MEDIKEILKKYKNIQKHGSKDLSDTYFLNTFNENLNSLNDLSKLVFTKRYLIKDPIWWYGYISRSTYFRILKRVNQEFIEGFEKRWQGS